MARSAGIVIRVEPETREKLNQIAQDNGVELATELYKVVARIADGELDLLALAGGMAPAKVDIDSKINEAIAPITGEIAYLKKLVASLIESSDGGKIINVEAIASDSENSPSRMAPIERNEPVTMNHTSSTTEAVTGPEKGGLTQSALNELLGFNRTDNRPRKWREAGPEVLAMETKAVLGTAYRFDESAGRFGAYFPMED